MTDRELMQQALGAMEADEHDMVPDQEGHMVFRKEAAITALRERLAQPQMQPCAGRNCGSTNPNLHSAECFEDYEKSTGMAQPEQEPVAWVYPEGVEALNAGKPWTAYGTRQEPNNIALYLSPSHRSQAEGEEHMTDYSDYEIERRIMIEYARPILERMEKFEQPEALRLATVLENKLGRASDDDIKSAAAELRKLFSEKEFHRATAAIWVQIAKAHQYRIATLEKNT